MPNTEIHFGIAIIVLIIFWYILDKLHLTNIIPFLVTLCIFSVLPDILEPARDYNHRKFFHSKTVLKFLYKYALGITFILALFFNIFFYLFFGIIGYIFHLLLDWTTPMGLPD